MCNANWTGLLGLFFIFLIYIYVGCLANFVGCGPPHPYTMLDPSMHDNDGVRAYIPCLRRCCKKVKLVVGVMFIFYNEYLVVYAMYSNC